MNQRRSKVELKFGLIVFLVFIAALLVFVWVVRNQAAQIAAQQRQLVLEVAQASYEREVEQLVEVARTLIQTVADQPGVTYVKQRQVLKVLADLTTGPNGYFFVYDSNGRLLLEPENMRLNGVDFCDPAQEDGAIAATQLLKTAYQGGGLVQYDWHMPSSQQNGTKISYVSPADRWGWIIGTGVYINDIEDSIKIIEKQSRDKLNLVFDAVFIFGFLAVSILFAFYYGFHRYVLNWINKKVVNLNSQVDKSSEQHRERIARDLHDGVLQVMASTKYILETVKHQVAPLNHASKGSKNCVNGLLDHALVQICTALQEVRHLMHRINTSSIDAGLVNAIAQLLHTAETLGFETSLRHCGEIDRLPASMQIDIFRMAQEAVANAQKHSGGTAIEVDLLVSAQSVQLNIRDNGKNGFQPSAKPAHEGMGLRNLRARAAQYCGSCQFIQSEQGVQVRIELPISMQEVQGA